MPRLMNVGSVRGKAGGDGRTSRKKKGDGRKSNSNAGQMQRKGKLK